MGTLQAKVGQATDVKGTGNSHRRIRLLLDVPGYGPGDAARLEDTLAVPMQELRTTQRAILERLSSIAEQPLTDGNYAAVAELTGVNIHPCDWAA